MASNSGVPSGTTLTSYTGPTTITTAGTVINAQWIKGSLTINANNVTVENSKIEEPSGAYWGIIIGNNVTGTNIIHNEIYDDGDGTGNGGYIGIRAPNAGSATSYTFVCGNYLHNWENDITCGPNLIAQSNYIDKMQNNATDQDADGIENYYGGNTRFWGNNILGYGTDGVSPGGINSALNITATGVNIDNVQINGNWIGGGGFTLDLDQQSGATATNISATNNIWYKSPAPVWGPVGDHASTILSAWTNNKYDDGTVLPQP